MLRVRLAEFLDKLVLLGAMLLFLWIGLSAIRQTRDLDAIAGMDRPLLSEMMLNAPRYEATPPDGETLVWPAPRSQSRGQEWIFDVFTPPVIYYDPGSQAFAVTPPSHRTQDVDDSEIWARFDIELIDVQLRPYRLQLVGYAGESGRFVAYFEDSATRGLRLLREGEELEDLGVRLVGFEEQRMEARRGDGTPTVQTVGIAHLHDYESGLDISLTNMETKMFSDLEARVRVLRDGAVHLVKKGSRVEVENGVYVIGDLSAQPEEAIVTKISKDGSRRLSKTLTPISTRGPRPSGSRDRADGDPFAKRPSLGGKNPRI